MQKIIEKVSAVKSKGLRKTFGKIDYYGMLEQP
jgi:hypothetical protein